MKYDDVMHFWIRDISCGFKLALPEFVNSDMQRCQAQIVTIIEPIGGIEALCSERKHIFISYQMCECMRSEFLFDFFFRHLRLKSIHVNHKRHARIHTNTVI